MLCVPLIGTAAAIGLVLFFTCAIYTDLLARDGPQWSRALDSQGGTVEVSQLSSVVRSSAFSGGIGRSFVVTMSMMPMGPDNLRLAHDIADDGYVRPNQR